MKYILAHQTARDRAKAAIDAAPDNHVVRIDPPKKSRDQEEKYHSMIGDIAKQCTFMGQKWTAEDWKRLLVDAFAKVMRDAGTPLHHDSRIAPSLDGERFVQMGVQTRDFWKKEANAFVEYLYAYGSEEGVTWTEPNIEPPEGYSGR